MEDVAAEAGVSRALVSLVIRNAPHVRPDKRKAVNDAIEKLGYRRNRLASRLASHRTNTVGLFVLDIRNTIYSDIADGLADVVEPLGSQVLIVRGSRDAEAERAALESLVDLRVDGIAVAGYLGRASTLEKTLGDIPAVIMTRHFPLSPLDSVTSHDERGAELAVQHLVDLGHSRIAHISAPLDLPYPDRRAGYLEIMSRAGLTPQLIEGDLRESGGYDAVDKLFAAGRERPTAVFCFNDATAFGAMRRLDELGLRIPDDVAIVGYDDTTEAGFHRVGLTSVNQRTREVGQQGGELLMGRINGTATGSRGVRLEPELKIRRSTIGG
jgi:DNA-binding LacI/PurR family transcriptional regulator